MGSVMTDLKTRNTRMNARQVQGILKGQRDLEKTVFASVKALHVSAGPLGQSSNPTF